MRTMSGSPCLHYDCSNRNSFGYCKTTVCINEHYQQEQWWQSTTNKSGGVVIKQQTNGYRIRAMTDEELAEFINDAEYGFIERPGMCDVCDHHKIKDCLKCWLDWIQQEAAIDE